VLLDWTNEVIEYPKIVAMHGSVVDAVDGSSTGTSVP
jgi:hypothetical protein